MPIYCVAWASLISLVVRRDENLFSLFESSDNFDNARRDSTRRLRVKSFDISLPDNQYSFEFCWKQWLPAELRINWFFFLIFFLSELRVCVCGKLWVSWDFTRQMPSMHRDWRKFCKRCNRYVHFSLIYFILLISEFEFVFGVCVWPVGECSDQRCQNGNLLSRRSECSRSEWREGFNFAMDLEGATATAWFGSHFHLGVRWW